MQPIQAWALLLSLVVLACTEVRAQCPTTPQDTVVPVTSFDPPPQLGEPEMSLAGVLDFSKRNGVRNVKELMSALPAHFNKNYVLMEKTGGTGHASLEFPRIILFGSDARFLMNVATDPRDPDYERLDVAHMNPDTGNWDFGQFDFTGSQPKLAVNPPSCTKCHGTPNRPFWGTYLEWPGAFGDDPRPGKQHERLTARHAARFNELKAGRGNPDRFHTLVWARRYQAGHAQFLPDHRYGYAMTIFNKELGLAVAESVFLRIQKKFPERYRALREEILLLGYSDRRRRRVTREERLRIAGIIKSLGGTGDTVDDLFEVLGVSTRHEFSLDKLSTEPNDPRWNVSSGDLYGLVYARILDDLSRDDRRVWDILANGPNGYGIWQCRRLGRNTLDVLHYKLLHGWKLRGSARQAVQRKFFGIDIDRIYQPVLDQIDRPLYDYLRTRIGATPQGYAWTESADAGSLPKTAQTAHGRGVATRIEGTLGANDADLYWVRITDPKAFSAQTCSLAAFDTQLFLFDEEGRGITGNDNACGSQSSLRGMRVLRPGVYLLGIAAKGYDPATKDGKIWIGNGGPFGAPNGPGASGRLDRWLGRSSGQGSYGIRLTSCSFAAHARTLHFGRGAASRNGTPRLATIAEPIVGSVGLLEVDNPEPTARLALVVMGLSRTDAPLPHGRLLVADPIAMFANAGPIPVGKSTVVQLPIPSARALAGARLAMQAFLLVPASTVRHGYTATAGLEWVLGHD